MGRMPDFSWIVRVLPALVLVAVALLVHTAGAEAQGSGEHVPLKPAAAAALEQSELPPVAPAQARTPDRDDAPQSCRGPFLDCSQPARYVTVRR